MTWDKITKAVFAVAGAVAGFFGEWNTMLTIFVVMMALDYVSGLIVAACGRLLCTYFGGTGYNV